MKKQSHKLHRVEQHSQADSTHCWWFLVAAEPKRCRAKHEQWPAVGNRSGVMWIAGYSMLGSLQVSWSPWPAVPKLHWPWLLGMLLTLSRSHRSFTPQNSSICPLGSKCVWHRCFISMRHMCKRQREAMWEVLKQTKYGKINCQVHPPKLFCFSILKVGHFS